jgi:hypothetical protein
VMVGEKLFEHKVKTFLHSMGVYVAGTPAQKMLVPIRGWFTKIWGGGFQKSGIPDLLCSVNGIFVSIELKASRGVSSELQKRNTRIINQSGGIGIILYPEGFDSFKILIKEVIGCNSHIRALNASKTAHSGIKCNILTE